MYLYLCLLAALALVLAANGLRATFTALGLDPPTVNRLNGESFQQDAIVSFAGYQYTAFYGSSPGANANTTRHVSAARRKLPSHPNSSLNPKPGSSHSPRAGSDLKLRSESEWGILTLIDYAQTLDDGHDVISLGICPDDRTLHLSWDQHDNNLNYRVSRTGVAGTNITWDASLFGPVMNVLPGLEDVNPNPFFTNVTYPRFLTLPSGSLLLEFRVGRSGLGDDWLYTYSSHTGTFSLIGKYLLGVNNNAYINGLDADKEGTLHVTWTYRDFVNDTGQAVNVEAGPNGPENNHDLNYAFSPSSAGIGKTWLNNWAQPIAHLNGSTLSNPTTNETFSGTPITPGSAGIVIFGIPKFGGILNQESQTLDAQGRIHVLNRENTTADGVERWYHYFGSPKPQFQVSSSSTPTRNGGVKFWTRAVLPTSINDALRPTVIGKRGKLFSLPIPVSPSNSSEQAGSALFALLPSNVPNSTALSLFRSTSAHNFTDWKEIWSAGSGCSAEPVFDRYRLTGMGLDSDGEGGDQTVLSVLVVNGTRVGVLDVDLSGLV